MRRTLYCSQHSWSARSPWCVFAEAALHWLHLRCVLRPGPRIAGVDDNTRWSQTGSEYFFSQSWEAHAHFNASGRLENDISIIKLPVSSAFTPAPVNINGSLGEVAMAAGYGRLTSDITTTPAVAYRVKLPIVDTSACGNMYGGSIRADKRIICAGEPGLSICPGDSGGPLATLTPSGWNVTSVVGISSATNRTCGTGYSMFTRVSYFAGWLRARVPYLTHGTPAAPALPRAPACASFTMTCDRCRSGPDYINYRMVPVSCNGYPLYMNAHQTAVYRMGDFWNIDINVAGFNFCTRTNGLTIPNKVPTGLWTFNDVEFNVSSCDNSPALPPAALAGKPPPSALQSKASRTAVGVALVIVVSALLCILCCALVFRHVVYYW